MEAEEFGPRRFRPRVEKFITEYLKDLNGTQAAIRAGYSTKSARYQASKLLRNVAVSQAIRLRFDIELKANHASIRRIVRELSLIAFCDPGQMLDEDGRLRPLSEISPELRHGILGLTVTESRSGNDDKNVRVVQRVRFDKLTALNLLVRHYGMLTDRLARVSRNWDDWF